MARSRFLVVLALMLILPRSAPAGQTPIGSDMTPPSVRLMNPSSRSTTRQPRITVRSRVSNASSGIAKVTCNGQPATVVRKTARCVVPLLPGLNDVIVQAIDGAGNRASAGVQITRAVKRAAAIALTPSHRTLLLDETATLHLVDDAGVYVAQARWKTSDSHVVTLSADDPPVLTAVGFGTASVTARKNGLMSLATIAVVAGAELAPGTTRWSVAPVTGLSMEPPIYANRVDETTPELFIVEGAAGDEAIVRGVDVEGHVMWTRHSPGVPLLGDSFGGVIAGVVDAAYPGAPLFQAFARLGDSGGVAPWRYDSAGILLRPAQSPEGTLYAIEFTHGGVDTYGSDIWDKAVIVINGITGGVISRSPLAREVVAFESANEGLDLGSVTCRSSRREVPPDTVGPIVGSDGRGYLLVRRRTTLASGSCILEFNPLNVYPRTQDVGVDLLALSATEPLAVNRLYDLQCNSGELESALCDVAPDVYQLLPDGVGGLLASWRRPLHETSPHEYFVQNYLTRLDADGGRVDTPVDRNFGIDMIGQAGTAYVRTGTSPGTSAIDVRSWSPKWTADISGQTLLAARPDGGVATIDDAGDLRVFGSTGENEDTVFLGLSPMSAAHESDSWIGVKDGELTSVAGQFQDATRWVPELGNRQGTLAVRNPGVGIFAKSHLVQWPLNFHHVSIRITPSAQSLWLSTLPNAMLPVDDYGNHFFTLGAGTAAGDTSLLCSGTLSKGVDREHDVADLPLNLERLPIHGLLENGLITALIDHYQNYPDDLPYACFPEIFPGTYNSNSFASGLLISVGAPLPLFPIRGTTLPGWPTPVPRSKFNPQ